ncbi:MlaE family lipid ABC transporter permease subunit [Rhodospirillaceae bacterium SYSU D60014]|uniref:MlaE family lipid ABC transporter permease subunit n=1 Tax=Virgifigura deserti TaxID=2268457 RepID=UPI000E665439
MATAAGWFDTARDGEDLVIAIGGRWTLEAAKSLDASLQRLLPAGARSARFDLAPLEELDTAGAWLIERTRLAFDAAGVPVTISGVHPEHAQLLDRVAEAGPPPPPMVRARKVPGVDFVAGVGEGAVAALRQGRDLLGFFGLVILTALGVIARPGRIRMVSAVSHLERVGLNAMPIVGLISFLVGVVLAYQGVDQLRQFGAEVFTVNLVGIAVLREMGILLTAIVVAGRSGSAFTAQIGTMKVNEEVDALRTLGLDPVEVLVLPRILALMIALPLLAFFADIMALLGGGLMLVVLIDATFPQMMQQMQDAVALSHLWVGLSKAPVFAFLIAMVGCFEGLRVSGSAESVGRLTTQSVVESIFLVIVVDAIFSILFSYMGV